MIWIFVRKHCWTILLAALILIAVPVGLWLLLPLLRNMSRAGWLALLSIALVLIAAPVIGSLVLGPVNRAAGRLHAPTRFLLPDFMWLLVQLQLVLGYCVGFVGVQTRYFFPLVLGFLMLASIMMWAGAVSFLSRAGVRSNLRRGSFILLLMPATLALMIGTPILPVLAYLLHNDADEIERLFRVEVPPHAGLMLLAVGLLCIPMIAWGLHRLGRWLVAGLTPPEQPALLKQSAT